MFKRIGTTEHGVIEVIQDYDKKNETPVLCPSCHKELSIKASNGLKRQGSSIVVGGIITRCPHCKNQIAI
jgi:hypothetical protein